MIDCFEYFDLDRSLLNPPPDPKVTPQQVIDCLRKTDSISILMETLGAEAEIPFWGLIHDGIIKVSSDFKIRLA